MTDTPTIQPALSAEQWARYTEQRALAEMASDASEEFPPHRMRPVRELDAVFVMALANAALPDGDPRKVTWAMVDAIRAETEIAAERASDPLSGLDVWPRIRALKAAADALASLLPPRES